MNFVAAQPIQAGVDDDAVQPAADRGVVAKRAGAAVGRDHGLLQRIFGVLGATTGQPGKPVQVPVVAVEQLLEGVAVTRDMSSQQFCVAALFCHGRTLTNRRLPGTSPVFTDLACTVISEMLVRLSPLVVPSVGIHTSR